MKNFNVFSILLVAIVFLAMGCSNEQAVNPADNSLAAPNSGSLAKGKGPVIESVTGSGHLTRANPAGIWRTFSFTARRYSDGTVEGNFVVHDHTWTDAKGPITCFRIEGNQAWLYGVIEKSSEPSYIGTLRVIRVIDNGEGKKAAPDQVSFLNPVDPGEFCPETPPYGWPVVFDIEAGNVQVKGGGLIPTS